MKRKVPRQVEEALGGRLRLEMLHEAGGAARVKAARSAIATGGVV